VISNESETSFIQDTEARSTVTRNSTMNASVYFNLNSTKQDNRALKSILFEEFTNLVGSKKNLHHALTVRGKSAQAY